MATASEHYEQLLSKHYLWMFGTSFEEKVAEQRSILTQALATLKTAQPTPLAIDLGCGPGFQAIALAQLGYSPVIAIDTSADLLDELRLRIGSLPIQIEQADLRDLPRIASPASASVIVCMGDTLTHLPAKSDVTALFSAIFNALTPGGIFVLTWRDLTSELQGSARFLPVRSDENAIMTCFLEYTSEDTVQVHDLIYTRLDSRPEISQSSSQSGWTLNASSYPKLRLSAVWIAEQLAAAGLIVDFQGPAGRLLQITAHKP